MDNCIFCKIVKGEIPAYKVAEDEKHLAFLAIQPFNEGHTLVIPKTHIEYLFDMPQPDLLGLMVFSKQVATRLKQVFMPGSRKIGVMVSGEEIPHVHVHLVPFNRALELSFSRAKNASPEELQQTLEKIKVV